MRPAVEVDSPIHLGTAWHMMNHVFFLFATQKTIKKPSQSQAVGLVKHWMVDREFICQAPQMLVESWAFWASTDDLETKNSFLGSAFSNKTFLTWSILMARKRCFDVCSSVTLESRSTSKSKRQTSENPHS